MAKYSMDMVLQYSKIFFENRDEGNDSNKAARKAKDMGGKYSINAFFTSEDQITKLLEDGMEPAPLGYPRVKEGDNFGIGQYIQISRFHNHTMTFKNKKGEQTEVDFGGAPTVVDLTQGVENKRRWSYDDDGELGHGTAAKVQFETYSSGSGLRLLAVAITDHVVYEGATVTEDDELYLLEDE
jgi:hypothetical protein